MSELLRGDSLGQKIKKSQCKRICKELDRLMEQIHPLISKEDSQKTKREKSLELYHELFWEIKVFEMTNENEFDHEVALGFEKAIMEKCVEK